MVSTLVSIVRSYQSVKNLKLLFLNRLSLDEMLSFLCSTVRSYTVKEWNLVEDYTYEQLVYYKDILDSKNKVQSFPLKAHKCPHTWQIRVSCHAFTTLHLHLKIPSFSSAFYSVITCSFFVLGVRSVSPISVTAYLGDHLSTLGPITPDCALTTHSIMLLKH